MGRGGEGGGGGGSLLEFTDALHLDIKTTLNHFYR